MKPSATHAASTARAPTRTKESLHERQAFESSMTIQTIAERAHIHAPTVFTRPERDAEDRHRSTRRIQALAKELGYTPSHAGFALRTARATPLDYSCTASRTSCRR
jgi:hypothetical protein